MWIFSKRTALYLFLFAFVSKVSVVLLKGYMQHILQVCPRSIDGANDLRCCEQITSDELLLSHGGTEDVVVDQDTGFVFVSVCDHLDRTSGGNYTSGGIFGYHPTTKKIKKLNVVNMEAKNFAPHGMSLHIERDDNGNVVKRVILAILHEETGDTVVQFFVTGDLSSGNVQLKRGETFSDPEFISLNDVAAYSENEFYVTNDHGYKPPMSIFEDILQLPTSSVLFYSGELKRTSSVGVLLRFANGISLSMDKQVLYVAELFGQRIVVYKVLDNFKLHSIQQVSVPSLPDNIDVDPSTGNLLIGAHPRALSFVQHSISLDALSPSQVLYCVTSETGEEILHTSTIYMDDGAEISASSVAAIVPKQNRMIIGAVFQSKILDCML